MFTEQEKQLIVWGKANGKSQQEVEKALSNFRAGIKTTPVQEKTQTTSKNIFQKTISGAKDIFEQGGERAINEFKATGKESQDAGFLGGVLRQAEGGLRQVGNVARVTGELVGKPLMAGVSAVGDELKKVPAIQDILGTESVDRIRTGITNIVGRIDQFKKTDPNLAKDLEAVVEIGGLLLMGASKPVTGALKYGEESLVGAKNSFTQGIKNTVKNIEDVPETLLNKTSGLVEKAVAKPLSKPVETVLRGTSSKKFDEYVKIAQEATTSFKNQTPLEYAGKQAQQALDTIQRKLSSIGSQKSSVINQASVGNKPVGDIVTKFRQSLNNYIGGKTTVEGDTKLIRDIMEEAKNLGSNPKAKDVDKFIDFVQDRIYTGKGNLTIPVTNETTASIRRLVGELNSELKNKLPKSYSNLNDQYSSLVELRNELNLKLGVGGEKGGSLMKRVFSPSDAGTKELFESVKEITGIDLVDEATLARFVMESVGDARQANLLEQLQLPNLSTRGLADFLLEKATAKFNTPEDILKRARELTIQD